MTEYIDKAAAVRILEAKSDMTVCNDAQLYFMAAAKMIGLLPSADVAPVIHAHWIFEHHPRDTGYYFIRIVCSNCGLKTDGKSKYCPNCGAKMDESEDEE